MSDNNTYTLGDEKLSNHTEEIDFLHREIVRLEKAQQVESSPEQIHETITAVTKQYAETPSTEVLETEYQTDETVIDAIALGLAPEEHDAKMSELIRLVQEKGIRNTMAIVERMKNPHITDDFHRFLTQYLKNGYEVRGLGAKSDLNRALKMVLYSVAVPRSDEKDKTGGSFKELVSKMEHFYSGMRDVRDKKFKNDVFTIEIALPHEGQEVMFYVGVPERKKDLFEKQVQAAFSDASVHEEVDDYNIFNERGYNSVSVATLEDKPMLPIRTYDKFDHDPLSAILNSFAKINNEGEGMAIQFIFKPQNDVLLKRYKKAADDLKKGIPKSKALNIQETPVGEFLKGVMGGNKKPEPKEGETPKPVEIDETLIEGIREKISAPIMRANIRLVASAETQARADDLRNDLESSFNQFENTQGNRFKFKTLKGMKRKKAIKAFTFRNFSTPHAMVLNLKELTTLVHFPVTDKVSDNINRATSSTSPAPVGLPTSGLLLGDNIHRGKKTPIYVDAKDRLRHMYVIGQTGTGKSGFLKNLIIQDIQNGEGVCMIDPHGEDIQDVLAAVPPERYDDVIYFDPGDTQFPMGLNMLEYDTNFPEQKTFVVNEMLSIFNKLFDMKATGGPMFEQYFRNSVMLAIDDPSSGSTLLDVSRVLADDDFREMKLNKCNNPTIVQFWRNIAGKAGGQSSLKDIVPYITSKFDVFLSNDIMRPIIAQQKSAFDFRDVMDTKKIFLINLSKGRLGEINAHLLGLIFVGKLLMSALSRTDGDLASFPPFYLYLDEFQNVTTDSISQILSEARKYKLSLFVAHQYIAQLDDSIKNSVFGNVGNMVTFRVGPEDSEYLEKQYLPIFGARDIRSIDNYNAYVRMLAFGKPTEPFNIATHPPFEGNREVARTLKKLSQQKYGRPRDEIEAEIMARYRADEPKEEKKEEDFFGF